MSCNRALLRAVSRFKRSNLHALNRSNVMEMGTCPSASANGICPFETFSNKNKRNLSILKAESTNFPTKWKSASSRKCEEENFRKTRKWIKKPENRGYFFFGATFVKRVSGPQICMPWTKISLFDFRLSAKGILDFDQVVVLSLQGGRACKFHVPNVAGGVWNFPNVPPEFGRSIGSVFNRA